MNVKGMFQTGRRRCGSCGHHQKNAEPPPEQDREREVGTLMTTTTTTLDRSVTEHIVHNLTINRIVLQRWFGMGGGGGVYYNIYDSV